MPRTSVVTFDAAAPEDDEEAPVADDSGAVSAAAAGDSQSDPEMDEDLKMAEDDVDEEGEVRGGSLSFLPTRSRYGRPIFVNPRYRQ